MWCYNQSTGISVGEISPCQGDQQKCQCNEYAICSTWMFSRSVQSGVSSSRGARGGFLPRHDEDLREPLVRRQGSQVSTRVARGPLGLALGSPIFPSGCEGTLGVALESLQGLRDLT